MKNLWVWSFENFQNPGTSSSPGFKNLFKKTNCFHEKISKKNWQFYRKLFDQFLVFWEPWLYSKTSSILFVELSRYVTKPPVLGAHSNNHLTLERTGCCKIHSQPNTGKTVASVGESSY